MNLSLSVLALPEPARAYTPAGRALMCCCSKVAMVALVQHCRRIGVELIDVQVLTDHTASMGAVEIRRDEYLERLQRAVESSADWRDSD